MTYEAAFARLDASAFRRRFHLTESLRRYVAEKGMETIRRHAQDFVRDRLAPAHPANDGRQTPMRGHPVFVAQHATATCCRGCMNRWWKVPIGVPLTAAQQEKTVGLVMAWIARQTLVLREKRKTEKPLLRDRKEFAILLRHGTTIENTCQEGSPESAQQARPR